MQSTDAWAFSGRLHETDTATVVRVSNGEILSTDGPFVEAREHLGGFYIINAEDLDAALAWASKVTSSWTACLNSESLTASTCATVPNRNSGFCCSRGSRSYVSSTRAMTKTW